MHAFNSILQEKAEAVDQIPVQIPIGTPIALQFIEAALLLLPNIIGASNLGASNHTIFGKIEHDFQQLGTDIVGIIHHPD
jgi:hypothetical protein